MLFKQNLFMKENLSIYKIKLKLKKTIQGSLWVALMFYNICNHAFGQSIRHQKTITATGEINKIIDIHFHAFNLDSIKYLVDKYFVDNRKFTIQKLGVITIASKGDTTSTRAHNDILINFATHDKRIFPVCSVHPYDLDFSLRELYRLKEKGVKVIKLHPNTQNFNVADTSVFKIAQRAGALGIALLFDGYNPFDANQIGEFISLAIKCPDTQIIIAHTGMFDFTKLNVIAALKTYPFYKKNIWVDISAIAPELLNSPYRDQVIFTLRNIGIDHVLFGSDTPFFSVTGTVNALQKSGFNVDELNEIYHDNAVSLFRLY
jgi:predicted TIM-barrel fold metal-dependent hydrolase